MDELKQNTEDYKFYLREGSKVLEGHVNSETKIKELDDKISLLIKKDEELKSITKEVEKGVRPLLLGVVGGFSTGKSSFINSLIGDELLGVKVQPATAKITKLVYGETKSFKEVLKNGSVNEISEVIYQKNSIHNNTSNVNNKIDYYQISLNKPFLQIVNIVDTPGFSSTSFVDDELTKEWVKKLDVLV